MPFHNFPAAWKLKLTVINCKFVMQTTNLEFEWILMTNNDATRDDNGTWRPNQGAQIKSVTCIMVREK